MPMKFEHDETTRMMKYTPEAGYVVFGKSNVNWICTLDTPLDFSFVGIPL